MKNIAEKITESKCNTKGSIKEERITIFGVILDDILRNMKARFADFKNFKFISLVHGKNIKILLAKLMRMHLKV